MKTAEGRPAPTPTNDRLGRRHTHTQHRQRVERMLTRAARREVLQEVAAW